MTPYGLRKLKLQGEDEELFGQGGGIGERVISEQAAHALIYMMQQVIDSGTGTRARLPDRKAAGKTGTTNSSVDAWFVGFTADYVVGVWMGYDQPKPMKGVTGGGLPADIWREVMVRVNEGVAVRDLPTLVPQNTVAVPAAVGPSPDIGGVERPIAPEEVPYFDAPTAPSYQGGSTQQGARGSREEDIDRALREALGME